MDDEHQGMAGYSYNSHDCLNCHPTGEKGDFQEHDSQYFPIYSGEHLNTWDDCLGCHTDSNNRKLFSCVDCHEHEQQLMDPKHSGITGYLFDSASCFLCHPIGEKGDFQEHDSQYFPIYSGEHLNTWDDCLGCHTDSNNRKLFSCVDCHEHGQQLMDPEHSGITGYLFESASCFQCHPTGEKGDFQEHDSQYFPIYSGEHREKWDSCTECHNVPGNNKIFSCIDCHEHNQSKMDDEHLGEVANYQYTSAACFDCHPDGEKGDD